MVYRPLHSRSIVEKRSGTGRGGYVVAFQWIPRTCLGFKGDETRPGLPADSASSMESDSRDASFNAVSTALDVVRADGHARPVYRAAQSSRRGDELESAESVSGSEYARLDQGRGSENMGVGDRKSVV